MVKACFFVLASLLVCCLGLGTKDVVVIILSQENEYHVRLAENLRDDLYEQSEELQQARPTIHFSHRDFPHVGGWTILPLISPLWEMHKENSTWMFFVEDRTKVKLKELLETLEKYDAKDDVWLGHGLHDDEPTIIHHFAFYENPKKFIYPNVASGIAMSSVLLKRLSDRLKQQIAPQSDFGIDNAHELALFMWNKGTGQVLQHEPALCIREGPYCAAFPTPFKQCGPAVPRDSIYFAVKTCEKFHEDRVPVVKTTWAKDAGLIEFFSDVQDEAIPTLSLGVPNTEQGHCGKTMAILKHVHGRLQTMPDVHWVAVTDDDTILGVSRLQQLLTCYDASIPIALGERYGYNVHSPRGYNYITGGGGMVFSKTLVQELVRPGNCQCPSPNAPDDMYLGICIANLDVTVTHSPLFHQARPIDYSPGYLDTKDAVSFHKHWMIDPINVYNKWFAEDDLRVLHQEL